MARVGCDDKNGAPQKPSREKRIAANNGRNPNRRNTQSLLRACGTPFSALLRCKLGFEFGVLGGKIRNCHAKRNRAPKQAARRISEAIQTPASAQSRARGGIRKILYSLTLREGQQWRRSQMIWGNPDWRRKIHTYTSPLARELFHSIKKCRKRDTLATREMEWPFTPGESIVSGNKIQNKCHTDEC